MRQRPVRLFVVEDSVEYLQLVREAFLSGKERSNWEIHVAEDGEKALRILFDTEKPGYLVPDLILLDWNLPKVSGSEVLQQVKAHDELRKIPVLVFSTSEAERDIHEAYQHHANGYITKPMDLDVLYQIADAVEAFWVAVAQLTSFKPYRSTSARKSVEIQ